LYPFHFNPALEHSTAILAYQNGRVWTMQKQTAHIRANVR
jgi:hypothetical protein